MIVCNKCSETQHSNFDKKYLEEYGNCWCCDRNDCRSGILTKQEFEKRENKIIKLLIC